ncbi:hypothetical protein SteCoe_3753 [Stentor coeruleus]|uniref:AN1-type domain-containing protein n=1 Tax=Stentor coeruleus TaxID=5963 RepID=A0A1R2CWC9_9CILI|nr:hypothetical protein SteCoe_3753 [Stentor coeruleus]
MDFVNLGAHCSVGYCKQQDFLPFLCDGCGKKFCLQHRCYREHKCSNVPVGNQVIICPLCGKGININYDADVNYLWEIHSQSSNCTQTFRVSCSNISCKKKLSEVNSITCNKCKKIVCLAHRFPDQHNCVAPKGNGFGCYVF